MSEPADDRRAALAQIAESWDALRTEGTLPLVHLEQQRRVRRRRALASAAALLVLSTAGYAGWSAWQRPVTNASRAHGGGPDTKATERRMRFEDGSEVVLLDAAAQIVVDEVTETAVAVQLSAGHARFEVVHRAERTFRVVCGDVTVEVLGTSFEIEREAERTRVTVLRGRVRVLWTDGHAELSAGEADWFPRAPRIAQQGRGPGPEAEPEPNLGIVPADRTPARAKHGPQRATADELPSAWRTQAEQGDFKRAYELLAHEKHEVKDDVEELMLAADAARLSGHPAQALPFLQQVVERHPKDSRAPLAAFTLGGVLMNQLGQPREAEAAYGQARALSLSPSLAQDALARQVEAAHRAGDPDRARTLAAEYLTRYPDGRRVHAVRRFGGLGAD